MNNPFIEVTTLSGESVWANINHIQTMREVNESTLIYFINDTGYMRVTESIQSILEKINNL